jgi:hypothetical protein
MWLIVIHSTSTWAWVAKRIVLYALICEAGLKNNHAHLTKIALIETTLQS